MSLRLLMENFVQAIVFKRDLLYVIDMESKLKLVYAPLNMSPVQNSTGIFISL